MTTPALDVMNPDSAKTIGGDLASDITALATRCADCTVATVEDLEQAVLWRAKIGEARKRVTDYFDPLTQMANRLHRALTGRRNDILAKLDGPDLQLAAAMSQFKAQQDRLRQEREREEAKQRQQEAEAAAAAEAAALEASGDHELAAAVVEDAITAAPPVVALPDVTRTVPGLKFTRRWKWKFAGGPADIDATPPAVIARTLKVIPAGFLKVDDVKIGAYVRSMKSSGAIPGIDIYYEDVPVR